MSLKYSFYNIIRPFVAILRRGINWFTHKNNKALFFYPHRNCLNDNYDVINNGADNVLILCDSILRDHQFTDYELYLLIFDVSKKGLYKEYCKQININQNINFVPYNDRKAIFKAFIRSSVIFTDNYYSSFSYKVKSQRVVCLGYFVVPFKDDYIKIKRIGYLKALKLQKERNRLYDYHVSTSMLCSRELSVDSLLYLPKYIPLGFPRNDLFYTSLKKHRDKMNKVLGFSPKTIISFVPTHRDYERKTHFLYDDRKVHQHTLFGEINQNDEEKLHRFLEDEDIIIIAKAHPIQETSILTNTSSKRIVYFSDLIQNSSINLQEILAASDLLVTDYSTACFDYLLTDRPIVYYFYDYKIERETRSFFIDPIMPICTGDIVYNISDFIDAIRLNITDPNRYAEKRKFLRDLLFMYQDGDSTARLKEFIKKLTTEQV